MRDRILFLALATFAIPFLAFIAELISWFFQLEPFISFVTKTAPDLFQLISIGWFAGLIYTSTRLVVLFTQPIRNIIIKVILIVVSVYVLTVILFFVGFSFMGISTSNLTIRSLPSGSVVGLAHHSSRTPNGAP